VRKENEGLFRLELKARPKVGSPEQISGARSCIQYHTCIYHERLRLSSIVCVSLLCVSLLCLSLLCLSLLCLSLLCLSLLCLSLLLATCNRTYGREGRLGSRDRG